MKAWYPIIDQGNIGFDSWYFNFGTCRASSCQQTCRYAGRHHIIAAACNVFKLCSVFIIKRLTNHCHLIYKLAHADAENEYKNLYLAGLTKGFIIRLSDFGQGKILAILLIIIEQERRYRMKLIYRLGRS